MTTALALLSIGMLAGRLGREPDAVRRAAKAAGVSPALKLNGIEHYDEADVPRIRRELNRRAAR